MVTTGSDRTGCAQGPVRPGDTGQYLPDKSQNRQITRTGAGRGTPGLRGPPRAGRRHRRIGHIPAANRNDGPPMLSGRGGQPHLWAIDAAATTSMGHRCGCPAPLSSIDGPSLLLRPGPPANCPVYRTPITVTITKYAPEPQRWPMVAVRGSPAVAAAQGQRQLRDSDEVNRPRGTSWDDPATHGPAMPVSRRGGRAEGSRDLMDQMTTKGVTG